MRVRFVMSQHPEPSPHRSITPIYVTSRSSSAKIAILQPNDPLTLFWATDIRTSDGGYDRQICVYWMASSTHMGGGDAPRYWLSCAWVDGRSDMEQQRPQLAYHTTDPRCTHVYGWWLAAFSVWSYCGFDYLNIHDT